MAAIQFTNIIDFVIIMPLGPQLIRSLNINTTQFGLVVSSYTFSAAISAIIGAFFLDKYNRKSAILFLYIGFILGSLFCGLSTTYETLVLSRIFTGAFGGLLSSLVLSVVADAVAPKERGKAIGLVMGSFSVASVVGIPLGLLIANYYSWNVPFYFISAMGAIITVFIFYYMTDMKGHITKSNSEKWHSVISKILNSKNQRNALLLTFLMVLGNFMVISFLSPYMVTNVGFSEKNLGLIYLIGGFVSFFTSPIIGKYADNHGKAKVFIFFSVLFIPLVFILTNLSQIPLTFALILTSIFFIIIGGRVIPATAIVTSTVEPNQRGSFMAFNSAIQQFGSGVAAFIAGIIIFKNESSIYQNFNYVGLFSITINILAIILISKIKTKQ